MNIQHITEFAAIPRPPRESFGFLEDIRKPYEYRFPPGQGCCAGENAHCMDSGATIRMEFPRTPDFPETAFDSLRNLLTAKEITETTDGYPLRFVRDESFGKEEFEVRSTPSETVVRAADSDGLRRGIYALENRIREAEGKAVMPGVERRKPFIRNRISRCFFGSTARAPFFIDELSDDKDYYPEAYLDKLAHEGVNGLWITMYFKDQPSGVFPGRGGDAERRFAKLRRTVEKCARYGIRIFVFLSEPKGFGQGRYSNSMEDAALHPELAQVRYEGAHAFFCAAQEIGKKYLSECMETLWKAVPALGGVINIMMGEDNGCCIGHLLRTPDTTLVCPVCSKLDPGTFYREQAARYADIIHRYNPNAEFIGWFYIPTQRDGSPLMRKMLEIAEKWPENASLMFNFESGGSEWQLGKKHIVFDYSLAYVGPSELFAGSTRKAKHTAAKLQVGCSHEDASVPFIPVPENLYDKYKFLYKNGVTSVMQCWYFGNYPGLMNMAAGRLSFEPFHSSAKDFLTELARPDWRMDAPLAAEAWHKFSMAYRQFPANLNFEWYGPLHHSIVWPLHLFPVDESISPSWLLNSYPEVSGDRFGECLGFHHTLPDALELCRRMSALWEEGMTLFRGLKGKYADDPARLADIGLAEAVGLQMKSARNWLEFYALREDMLFNRADHREEMKRIVGDEITNTPAMAELCEKDSRLGYHSEADGYLFFPAKLRARANLLRELLDDDFPKFDLKSEWIDRYTGRNPSGPAAVCFRKGTRPEEIHDMGNGTSWSASFDDENLYFSLNNVRGKNYYLNLEPGRMAASLAVYGFEDGRHYSCPNMFPFELPPLVKECGNDLKIQIPLSLFDGFRRDGFPMRMNICGKGFHWVEPGDFHPRLMFVGSDPHSFGWLILK